MAQNQNIPRRPWKIETTHRGVATHSLRTTGLRSNNCNQIEIYSRSFLLTTPINLCLPSLTTIFFLRFKFSHRLILTKNYIVTDFLIKQCEALFLKIDFFKTAILISYCSTATKERHNAVHPQYYS